MSQAEYDLNTESWVQSNCTQMIEVLAEPRPVVATTEPIPAPIAIEQMDLNAPRPESINPLDVQVAGDHYKKLKIQPIEYIHANNIPFAEGSVIKYVTRWREKDGIKDLKKAKHFIDLLIELESKAK